MNVVSSELHLSSAHRFERVETVTERLQINARGPASSAEGAQGRGHALGVMISNQGRALAAAETAASAAKDVSAKGESSTDAIESAAEGARKDPANQLLIALVEHLTGRRLRLFDCEPIPADRCRDGEAAGAAEGGPPNTDSSPPAGASGRGMSLHYQRSHSLQEYEATHFSARGVIRTADGQDIRFAVDIAMERSYYERSEVDIRIGEGERKDPLVINYSGSAAQLRDQRFAFDLDADGELDNLPTLASGSGYLVFDRNGDGEVNDGSELFGAISGDGYADLNALDGDGNGWIDAADAVSDQLYLWIPDSGGDARLVPLEEAGVAALSTSSIATPFELRGEGNADLGAVRSAGLYLSTASTVGITQQIDLTV